MRPAELSQRKIIARPHSASLGFLLCSPNRLARLARSLGKAMRRRDFVTGLSGAVVLPLVARAQNSSRPRTIGVFSPGAADNPEFEERTAVFLQALGQKGWIVGRNVSIIHRWGAGDVDRYRAYAEELVAAKPDVILAGGTAIVRALRQVTREVPIVFANISDPVGNGLIASLAHPGGNATGFTSSEMGFSGKWLELIKELKPSIKRVAVVRDSSVSSQIGMLGGLQSVAPSLGIELRPIDIDDAVGVARDVGAFSQPDSGLIVALGARVILNRELIIKLAAQHRLPAIYPIKSFVMAGGLMSYGADSVRVYQLAGDYVDRILRGAKPSDLPVHEPTKYELAINLKTAKALGISVPTTILARADEVIE
jgi:putative ABC transport system substrate-binding protein